MVRRRREEYGEREKGEGRRVERVRAMRPLSITLKPQWLTGKLNNLDLKYGRLNQKLSSHSLLKDEDKQVS